MTPNYRALTLCAALPLLAACPSSTAGDADDEETGTGGISADAGPDSSSDPTLETSDPTLETADSTETSADVSSSTMPAEESSDGGCGGDDDCDNGVFCDGPEACVDGACVPGDAVDCADDVECTADFCDTEADACVHDPDHTLCACGETCSVTLGCGDHCVVASCQNQVYECGNCLDDDVDCSVDSVDLDCWGPCDNNESGWDGEVPGQQAQDPCLVMDCYFDGDSGTGNDECYWSHSCDPLAPSECTYNANASVPGSPDSCAELFAEQSQDCSDYCGPLTPNGCDCFGCCQVTLEDDTTVTVYLGTQGDAGGTCNLDAVEDPTLCNPCTQVDGCLNTCEECELCIGQAELPPECEEQVCPRGLQGCGLDGQEPCPEGQSCVTGCCVPNPQ